MDFGSIPAPLRISGSISDIHEWHSGLLHHFSTDLRSNPAPFSLNWKEGCTLGIRWLIHQALPQGSDQLRSRPSPPQVCTWSHGLSRTCSFCTTYGSRRKQRSPEPGPPETGTRRWRRFRAWWWAAGPRSRSSWLTGSGWTPECRPTPDRARNRT